MTEMPERESNCTARELALSNPIRGDVCRYCDCVQVGGVSTHQESCFWIMANNEWGQICEEMAKHLGWGKYARKST